MSVVSEKKEKNLVKNYAILIVVFLLVIGITLYICKWYKVFDDYNKQTPVIRGTLQEIVYDDLEHYILENPTSTIYICAANSDKCRNFEKSFSKYVVKENLSNEIIYLNITDMDKDEFLQDFNNKYPFKVKLNGNYPSFVIFKDGKVDSILQGSENSDVTLSKAKNFLEINEIEGEE